jgi:hypothetical protein
MIKKIKNVVKSIFLKGTKNQQKSAAIIKPMAPISSPGIPAPVITKPDPWFNEPVKTELQMTHEKMLEVAREREEANKPPTKEPENIHEVMYNMATKNFATTLHLNPIGGSENFQGGSENIQRG